MRPKLNCPNAKYNSDMMINCSKRDEPCAHQRWCTCKGWAVLTDQAGNCPARKEEENGRKRKTAAKRRNKV